MRLMRCSPCTVYLSFFDKLDLMRQILPISGTRPEDLATFRLLASIRRDVERVRWRRSKVDGRSRSTARRADP